jgi:transposase
VTEPVDTTATTSGPGREGSVSTARPTSQRKSYPEEFKREAVELLVTSGRPLAQVARELGVSTESLRLWRKQAKIDGGRREGLVSEQREEPRRLRHENHKLKPTRIWVALAVIVVAVAALVVVLILALAGGDADGGTEADQAGQAPQTAQAVDGSFVGKVSGMKAFVAIVAAPTEGERNERAVRVYVADGNRISEWFSGSISDDQFVAKTKGGEGEAKGKLNAESVKGTVELPNGKTVRYRARRPAGAAGLYDLTVSARGKLSGTSAAGLGVAGRINLLEGTGVMSLADGRRLEFEIAEDTGDDLVRLRPGQVRLIVLPSGQLVGAGKSRPTADGLEGAFFVVG